MKNQRIHFICSQRVFRAWQVVSEEWIGVSMTHLQSTSPFLSLPSTHNCVSFTMRMEINVFVQDLTFPQCRSPSATLSLRSGRLCPRHRPVNIQQKHPLLADIRYPSQILHGLQSIVAAKPDLRCSLQDQRYWKCIDCTWSRCSKLYAAGVSTVCIYGWQYPGRLGGELLGLRSIADAKDGEDDFCTAL